MRKRWPPWSVSCVAVWRQWRLVPWSRVRRSRRLLLCWLGAIRRGQQRALGAQGSWRDMRDGATALAEAIASGTAVVEQAAGPAGGAALERARVFAWRLRAAALDQNSTHRIAASETLEVAFDELLAAIRGEPHATPTRDFRARMHFRPYLAVARAGDVVGVPHSC
jgi:hypothetical protein